MKPRVLLLQEDQASGGVSTISNTLTQALRKQDWQVTELALNQCRWRQRIAAAKQCDVILASHNFKPAYVAWALGLLLRKPVVVWVHGPLQEVLEQAHASSLKLSWLHWFYRRQLRFVFVSRASRDSFERFVQRPLEPHQYGSVIPNVVAPMVAPENSLWAAGAAVEDSVAQLAYIGRLSQEKRPELLLEMLRLLPTRFRLTLVGDGPMRDALRESGADLLVSGRLTLAGPQPHGPGLYTPWHMTLLASRYEGCPMTLLESFSLGVPCVGLPIAALQEVVAMDAPYLLARDDSAQALADAVLAVWAMPRPQVQADMGRVLSRYQVQDFVQSWQTILQEAAQRC